MYATRLILFVFLAAGLSLTGCGPEHKSVVRTTVSGKVTVDTKPLTTGTITFDPMTGEQPAVLDIVDGNYEGKAPIGRNTIRFSALRKISMRDKMGGIDGPGYDQLVEENYLPARYHSESKLARDVAEGENKFNFDLISN